LSTPKRFLKLFPLLLKTLFNPFNLSLKVVLSLISHEKQIKSSRHSFWLHYLTFSKWELALFFRTMIEHFLPVLQQIASIFKLILTCLVSETTNEHLILLNSWNSLIDIVLTQREMRKREVVYFKFNGIWGLKWSSQLGWWWWWWWWGERGSS
jgi:hypothetical protein